MRRWPYEPSSPYPRSSARMKTMLGAALERSGDCPGAASAAAARVATMIGSLMTRPTVHWTGMNPSRPAMTLALAALMCALVSGSSRQRPTPEQQRPALRWADWVEPDFPFFSSVIDAGRAGPAFPAKNLTPRGLVLKIGGDHWLGFDTDLLRVAA